MLLIIIPFFTLLYIYTKSRISDKLSKRIIHTFLTIWFIALTLSTFNPYGLYPVSAKTYLILILNVFSFTLGFTILRIDKKDYFKKNGEFCKENIVRFINNKTVITFIILAILLSIKTMIEYFSVLSYLNFNRDDTLEVFKENLSSTENILINLILPPLFYSLNAILAYLIVYNRKYDKILIVSTYIIIYSSIGGGRVTFLIIGIALLLISFMVNKIKITLQSISLILLIITITYLSMSYMTALRYGYYEFSMYTLNIGMKMLNEHFVTYLTIPFRLLDYALYENYLEKLGGYHYGIVSLDGINRYLKIILERFSVDIPAIYEKTTDFFQDNWVLVGNGRPANYAYTNIIYHYLDFGILGVIIFPFCFSILLRWTIKMFYKQGSVSSFCLLFYLFFVFVHTVFSWHLNKAYSLGFILLMVLFITKKRIVLIKRRHSNNI